MSDRTFIQLLIDKSQAMADKAKEDYESRKNRAAVESSHQRFAEALYWRESAQTFLNDQFYWLGHVNAYKGIMDQLELRAIVEEEKDAEGSCP